MRSDQRPLMPGPTRRDFSPLTGSVFFAPTVDLLDSLAAG